MNYGFQLSPKVHFLSKTSPSLGAFIAVFGGYLCAILLLADLISKLFTSSLFQIELVRALFKVDSASSEESDEEKERAVSTSQAIQRFKQRRRISTPAQSKLFHLLPTICLRHLNTQKFTRIMKKGVDRYNQFLDVRSLINVRQTVSSLVNFLLSDTERRLMLLRRKGNVINPSSEEDSSFDESIFRDDAVSQNWFLQMKKEDLKLYKSNISSRLY